MELTQLHFQCAVCFGLWLLHFEQCASKQVMVDVVTLLGIASFPASVGCIDVCKSSLLLPKL